mmetsp:Transcript_28305/g.81236  ORF Transcript_28305/g.81236 Transcript_28305/m.81236 type:complete len:93 (-) Transcript_28305:460-738(-)
MVALLSTWSRLMRHLIAGHTMGRRSSSNAPLRIEVDAELGYLLEPLRVDINEVPLQGLGLDPLQGLGLDSQAFASSDLLPVRLPARLCLAGV